MSHYHARYKSEEISPDDDSNVSVESRLLFVNCDEKPHAVGL